MKYIVRYENFSGDDMRYELRKGRIWQNYILMKKIRGDISIRNYTEISQSILEDVFMKGYM